MHSRAGSNALPNKHSRSSPPHHLCRCKLGSTQAVAIRLTTSFTAPTSGASGLKTPTPFKMLQLMRAPCVTSAGTKIKSLSSIASRPFCKWPRHEYRSVLHRESGNADAHQCRSVSCLANGLPEAKDQLLLLRFLLATLATLSLTDQKLKEKTINDEGSVQTAPVLRQCLCCRYVLSLLQHPSRADTTRREVLA